MKVFCFVCLLAALVFCAASMLIVVDAQSSSVSDNNSRNAAQITVPPANLAPAREFDSGGPYTNWVAISDVNRDGWPDLVVLSQCESGGSCVSSTVSVRLGTHSGTFRPPTVYSSGGSTAESVAIGDLNGDGWPDLVVANSNNNHPSLAVLLNKGNGTFEPPTNYSIGSENIGSVVIADLNGDHNPDLIVSTSDGGTVLLNNGNGTFQNPNAYSSGGYITNGLAVGDVNGDGIPDLVLANNCLGAAPQGCSGALSGSVSVLTGNGNGTFQPAVIYGSGADDARSVAIADLNGDGHADLVVTNLCPVRKGKCTGSVDVLLSNGNGTFKPAVNYPTGYTFALSVAVADMNGDGRPDLVVGTACLNLKCAGDDSGAASVLLGNGDGTFQAFTLYGSGRSALQMSTVADLNRDGRPDIVVSNCAPLNENACPAGNGVVAVILNNTELATETTLATSGTPSIVKQRVTFTASVTSSGLIPDGTTVKFFDGENKIGTAKTKSGMAHFTTSKLSMGSHTITATYPTGGFLETSSGSVTQVVNQ